MAVKIKDILHLLRDEVKNETGQAERFRELIEKQKWPTEQIRKWLDECLNESKSADDAYSRAFRNMVVSLGRRLGFEVQYGKCEGKSREERYDGIWKRKNGDMLVLEVKTTAFPADTLSQLGDYLEKLSKKEGISSIFGLYVIGKGDVEPLIEQISGSKYKDRVRLTCCCC